MIYLTSIIVYVKIDVKSGIKGYRPYARDPSL